MKLNIQKVISFILPVCLVIALVLPMNADAAAVFNIKPAEAYSPPYLPGTNLVFQAFDGETLVDPMLVRWSVEDKNFPGEVDELTRFDIPGILMISPWQKPGTIVVKAVYGSQTATFNLVVSYPLPLNIYPSELTYIAGKPQVVPLELITSDGLQDSQYTDLLWDYSSTQPDGFYVNEHGDLVIAADSYGPAMCIVRAKNRTSGEVLASTQFYLTNDITGNMGEANGGLGGVIGDYEDFVGQMPTIPGNLMDFVNSDVILESADTLSGLFSWDTVNTSLLAPMIGVLGISMLCYIPMGKKG